MKYTHGGRIALANINNDSIINERKPGTTVIEEYNTLMPTPSSSAFIEDIGLHFKETEFSDTLKFLGSGFFAEVYRVRHLYSNTIMAFKVPQSTESVSRFMKEVQLLKRLHHNNVLRFHGTCVFNGLFGCLTEFLDSGNLSGLIEQHGASLSWSTAVHIAGGISKGLAYLQQQSLVHRDLSSENILLHKRGEKYSINNSLVIKYRAVIADFGLFLNLKNNRSDQMSTVGNPFYTAPENLKNQTPYYYTSDVFSFGMILCEIVTGLKNDPNNIPRTNNYGLNYKELKVKKDCPKWLQTLTCDCCMVYVSNRPSIHRVCEIIAENKKYIGLWQSQQAPEHVNVKLYNSMDGMKLRTMSLSMHTSFKRERLKSSKITCFNGNINEPDIESSSCHLNGGPDSTLYRPLCRFNSVDSFIDPRLVNFYKASRDPCYVDTPLATSMRTLDPRRKGVSNRHLFKKLSRCCSESDLILRAAATKLSTAVECPDLEIWSEKMFPPSSTLLSSPKPVLNNHVISTNKS